MIHTRCVNVAASVPTSSSSSLEAPTVVDRPETMTMMRNSNVESTMVENAMASSSGGSSCCNYLVQFKKQQPFKIHVPTPLNILAAASPQAATTNSPPLSLSCTAATVESGSITNSTTSNRILCDVNDDTYAIKEWIWYHHKETILSSMNISILPPYSSPSSTCSEGGKDNVPIDIEYHDDNDYDETVPSPPQGRQSPVHGTLSSTKTSSPPLASLPQDTSSSATSPSAPPPPSPSPSEYDDHHDAQQQLRSDHQHDYTKYRTKYKEQLEVTHKLQDTNQQLRMASKLQLQHFASIIHEIRTPLNAVLGLSNVLQAESTGMLNQLQQESLNMIISSGDLLLTVVNDVLDYAKLETGNVDIEIKRSNLQETLNSIVPSIQTKADDQHISFRTYYDATIPEYIFTDSRRLQQILYNLLGNAIKFSATTEAGKDGPRRQKVVELHVKLVNATATTTSTTTTKDPFSTTAKEKTTGMASPIASKTSVGMGDQKRLEDHDTVLQFIVKDNGKGIDEKDMERIFQPFRQAGNGSDTERLYGGTGLGLAITSKLVHGLGGTISVKSQVGHWSEFTVSLPFGSRKGSPSSYSSDQQPINVKDISQRFAPNATILLIHDDVEYRDQIQHIFQQYNLDCVSFASMEDMEMAFSVKDDEWKAREHPSSFVLSRARYYVCLVHENSYDKASYEKLSSQVKTILLTFGPKYSVPETRGHFRSLLQVLPSVLMTSISETLVEVFVPSPSPRKKKPLSRGLVRAISQSSIHSTIAIPYHTFRILIAEDNIINQKVLLRMLQRLGFKHVDIVDNGQQAVDKEASQPYDVVLMDMQMPVMDGIEACRIISNRSITKQQQDEASNDEGKHEQDAVVHNCHPPAKVVFVTANVSNTIQEECKRAGGVGFLPKPINLHGIEECFEKLQLRPNNT